jgi:hypothetical protein
MQALFSLQVSFVAYLSLFGFLSLRFEIIKTAATLDSILWEAGLMLYDLAENLWSRLPELNRRPSNYESDALPTELSRLSS